MNDKAIKMDEPNKTHSVILSRYLQDREEAGFGQRDVCEQVQSVGTQENHIIQELRWKKDPDRALH